MVYDLLVKIIRKHFYVMSYEKYKNVNSTSYMERFVAKHPLLKPELIVVNDQPFGFKKVNRRYTSLEKYPIFIDLEYSEDEDGEKYIDSFDLYSESKIRIRDHLSDILQLSRYYSKYILLERVKRFHDPSFHVFLIYSKLNEIFLEEYFEHDVEAGILSEDELTHLFDAHFTSLIQFIRLFDDVVTKGKPLDSLTHLNIPE